MAHNNSFVYDVDAEYIVQHILADDESFTGEMEEDIPPYYKTVECLNDPSHEDQILFCTSCLTEFCHVCLSHFHLDHAVISLFKAYSKAEYVKRNLLVEATNLISQIRSALEDVQKLDSCSSQSRIWESNLRIQENNLNQIKEIADNVKITLLTCIICNISMQLSTNDQAFAMLNHCRLVFHKALKEIKSIEEEITEYWNAMKELLNPTSAELDVAKDVSVIDQRNSSFLIGLPQTPLSEILNIEITDCNAANSGYHSSDSNSDSSSSSPELNQPIIQKNKVQTVQPTYAAVTKKNLA